MRSARSSGVTASPSRPPSSTRGARDRPRPGRSARRGDDSQQPRPRTCHGGSEDEAVQHLEEARDVLRDLGDEEYEARVIANLGLVHRRQGHDDEAASLLNEALGKLAPESQAYRQVEEELLRAS
jgi:tetratricopeptide (TPR) repeat protein